MTRNPLVDQYFLEGCMRCAYGGTPRCKVIPWQEALEHLREIACQTGLAEERKWGVPVYTYQGKNIVSVNALKGSANLGFFKGVLLRDTHGLLTQQGNIQAGRIMKFTSVDDILSKETIIEAYIQEAVEVEASGAKVVMAENPVPIPEELIAAFDEDAAFKSAFFSLTPGRQRAYIHQFAQPKQSATRISRIHKYKNQILAGIGLHDEYRKGLS